jgi:hypothetical protein
MMRVSKSVPGYPFTNLEGVHRGFDIPYPFAPQPALQVCDLPSPYRPALILRSECQPGHYREVIAGKLASFRQLRAKPLLRADEIGRNGWCGCSCA